MSRIDDSLSETFGLPVPEREQRDEIAVQPSEADDDFEFVRETLRSLLDAGADAFADLANIARSEEKVSAYSAMNDMLSNLSNISVKLMDIQKTKREIENIGQKDKQQSGVVNNTTNVAFIGSTTDLAKLISNNTQGEIIDV